MERVNPACEQRTKMEGEDLNSPGDLQAWLQEYGPEASFQAVAQAKGFLLPDKHHAEQVSMLHPGFLIPNSFPTNRLLETDSDHELGMKYFSLVSGECLLQSFMVL